MDLSKIVEFSQTFSKQFKQHANFVKAQEFEEALLEIVSLRNPIKAAFAYERYQEDNNQPLSTNPFYLHIINERLVIIYIICNEIKALNYPRYVICCQDDSPYKIGLTYFYRISQENSYFE